MYKEHPAFNPPDDDAVLWRYMDFTKFVSLLDKSTLFFARADKLDDPFEGSVSRTNMLLDFISARETLEMTDEEVQRFQQDMIKSRKMLRRFNLINCWHENPGESAAMWKLYARETDGIAIKTDFNSFKNSLACSEAIYVGRVNYINYNIDVIPGGNTFYPFLYKRQSFEHEHEVRAMTMQLSKRAFAQDVCDVGIYYEVDLSLLIQEVIIAPYAQDWFLYHF